MSVKNKNQAATLAPSPAFVDYGKFVMRVPMLPFTTLVNVHQVSGTDFSVAECEYEARLAVEQRILKALWSRALVREAIRVASPGLYKRISNKKEGTPKQRLKLDETLYRYVLRMSTRATPFGMFASLGVGNISVNGSTRIAMEREIRRIARLDMGLLYEIAADLASRVDASSAWALTSNNSLYKTGRNWRYVEKSADGNYNLCSIGSNKFTDYCIKACAVGVKRHKLIAMINKLDTSITTITAEQFINELVTQQVLIPATFPSLTSHDNVYEYINRLKHSRAKHVTHICDKLTAAQRALEGLDGLSEETKCRRYDVVEHIARELLPNASYKAPYQVDAYMAGHGVALPVTVCQQVAAVVEPLLKIVPTVVRHDLAYFAERFVDRFGSAEVPLPIALDADFGVEFSSTALPLTPLYGGVTGGLSVKESTGGRHRATTIIDSKLSEWGRKGGRDLSFSLRELAAISRIDQSVSPSRCSVLFELAECPATCTGQHPLQPYLRAVVSPLGSQLFGRFCAGSPELACLVKKMIRMQEADNHELLFAEVVHVPTTHLANVTARPLLREYEIPYVNRSGAKNQCQIPVAELLLSVRAGKVHLRWGRTGSEVIPCLTNAHNYRMSGNLPLYKMLAMLSTQWFCPSYAFRWPSSFDSCVYLPRVTIEGVVVSLAQWTLEGNDLAKIQQSEDRSNYSRFNVVNDIREHLGIPRYVLLVANGNKMFVDMHSPLGVRSFLAAIRKKTVVRLTESFCWPGRLACHGQDGSYASEFILPLRRKLGTLKSAPDVVDTRSPIATQLSYATRLPRAAAKLGSHRRVNHRILPGAEWACFKVYASPLVVDKLICNHLVSGKRHVAVKSLRTHFFFIRYADPRWHLRLRINGPSTTLWSVIVPAVLSSFRDIARTLPLYDISIDSYVPEIERYGGPAVYPYCETLFWHDSLAVIKELKREARNGETMRWRYAIRSSVTFALAILVETDLVIDLFDKMYASAITRVSYNRKTQCNELANKYRLYKREVDSIILYTIQRACDAVVTVSDQKHGSIVLAHAIRAIRSLNGERRTTTVSSIIHMSMNRTFLCDANLSELMVYYFCVRGLKALSARGLAIEQALES